MSAAKSSKSETKAIRDHLVQLIQNEDPQNPLTDLALSRKIKELGFDDMKCGRITYHRRELDIPGVYKRRDRGDTK